MFKIYTVLKLCVLIDLLTEATKYVRSNISSLYNITTTWMKVRNFENPELSKFETYYVQ